MNLIERLEGYDKAKIKRDDINHTLENCEFLGGGDAREGLYERLDPSNKPFSNTVASTIFLRLGIRL